MSANAPNNRAGDGRRSSSPAPSRTRSSRFCSGRGSCCSCWRRGRSWACFAQLFTEQRSSSPNHDDEMDGALGGFALGWEGIPLACRLHLLFPRPGEIPRGLLAGAHPHGVDGGFADLPPRLAGDFAFTGVIIPLAGSLGLAALVFLHLFSPKPHPATTATQQQTE